MTEKRYFQKQFEELREAKKQNDISDIINGAIQAVVQLVRQVLLVIVFILGLIITRL